eukprot:13465177-Ditylum_brightwellii.AAC.1
MTHTISSLPLPEGYSKHSRLEYFALHHLIDGLKHTLVRNNAKTTKEDLLRNPKAHTWIENINPLKTRVIFGESREYLDICQLADDAGAPLQQQIPLDDEMFKEDEDEWDIEWNEWMPNIDVKDNT